MRRGCGEEGSCIKAKPESYAQELALKSAKIGQEKDNLFAQKNE